jgi:hypothetical protein
MSVDGTWKVTVQSPMGPMQADLTLKHDAGALSGTAIGAAGKADIANGKLNGDKATWSMSIQQPFPMTLDYDVTFAGNDM